MNLRDHLEAIRDLHKPEQAWDHYEKKYVGICGECDELLPCPSREHAVAALKIIRDAPRPTLVQYGGFPEDHVILHDPVRP